MGNKATVRKFFGFAAAGGASLAVLFALVFPGIIFSEAAAAQTLNSEPPSISADWHPIGNAAVELGLADVATGGVDRVWYVDNGLGLRVRTNLGKIYETTDFETWTEISGDDATVPPAPSGFAETTPEPDASLRNPPGAPSPRVYALGSAVFRSDDSGRHWEDMTDYQGQSILVSGGGALHDLAVSPLNEDQIVAAGDSGVFRSMDGGRSWHGLNQNLPNLPGARIRAVPQNGAGAQIELGGALVLEWQPGERVAWTPTDNTAARSELELKQILGQVLGVEITAVALNGPQTLYAGAANGRVVISTDGGRTWSESLPAQGNAVTAFWVDPNDDRMALVALQTSASVPLLGPRLLHTISGGTIWDDVSGSLPVSSVFGVTADPQANVVYVATDNGIYSGQLPLTTLGAPPVWTSVTGLPEPHASDVRLSSGGIYLWADVEGYGLFTALAPHHNGDPRVVSSADLVARAAAPGTLLKIVGARVTTAAAGGYGAPVLATADTQSEIQIPFEVSGDQLSLIVGDGNSGRVLGPLALQPTSPAIVVDDTGAPLVADADTGVLLDMSNPAHSGTRLEVFAVGLGHVTPDWPTGQPGPLDNPPEVVAPVTAYLDGDPVTVTRAVLAPGYVGFYLVEIDLPTIVDYGAATLQIQAGGVRSNAVRVYIEP